MVQFCVTCMTPDTRPRIEFDAEGVCNACRNAERKPLVDWASRGSEFFRVVDQYRGRGQYDCIVPWSGGKDSSAIAHKLKFQYGLNPLLATFCPLMPTEVGLHNREALILAGFDQYQVRPNQDVSRKLAKRFFVERGNPEVHRAAAINAFPVNLAVALNIPLIFYAEHGESEYGGLVLSEEHTRTRDLAEVIEHQIGDDPRNWVSDGISERDLSPYLYPDSAAVEKAGVKAYYFSYFFKWSVYENLQYIEKAIDFKRVKRSEGTFTNYDSLDDKIDNLYYYMQYIKFGFGRATRDASRLVQNGHMTREEALRQVRLYDAEQPFLYHYDTLDYLGMTGKEYVETVDLHRNPEIWTKTGNDWRLNFEPC